MLPDALVDCWTTYVVVKFRAKRNFKIKERTENEFRFYFVKTWNFIFEGDPFSLIIFF